MSSDQQLTVPPGPQLSFERLDLSDLHTLVANLEDTSPYAKGHARRVRAYAMAAARQILFGEHQLDLLRRAALFHDIGYIRLPDAIVNKRGPLTEEEWELMRQHTLLGAGMLREVSGMDAVAPIILQHHERYDGRGYPDRRHGGDIHILAQILAIAEAYEAMTSPRPYRPALSRTEAVAELRRGAWSQFNPNVVKIFIKATKEVETTDISEKAYLQLVRSSVGEKPRSAGYPMPAMCRGVPRTD